MDAERKHPFENNLILREIVSVLNCSESLLSCRAINKLWLTEFQKQALEKSVFVDLRKVITEFPGGLGYDSVTHSVDQRATIKTIKNLRVSNKIEVLQDARVFDFFEHNGKELKYLALEDVECVSFSSPVHFQFVQNVLFNWCPELETLRLIGMFEDESNASSIIPQKKEIPLRRLIMDFETYEYFMQSLRINVIGKVFESAKHLDSLSYIGYYYDRLLHYIPANLMRLASNHSKMLTSLELKNVTLKRMTLDVIINAGWPLKTLTFIGNFGEELRAQDLNVLLDTYKTSLKFLHLDISWSSWYVERDVEIIVHELTNLMDVDLNTNQVNVGFSGLLGTMKNLRHLALRAYSSQFGTQRDIRTMFRHGISTNLRSLILDEWYEPFINQIQGACPNLTHLEVACKARNLGSIFSGLNIPSPDNITLQDLKINASFTQCDIDQDNWSTGMVYGLSERRLRAFTLVASNSKDDFCPWIRKHWIENWLSGGEKKYFSLEFKDFQMRVDEFFPIVRLVVQNTNFFTLKVVLVDLNKKQSPRRLPLPEMKLFQYNVEDVLQDVSTRLREMKN